MPKFNVRFREIFIYDVELEATSMMEAGRIFADMLISGNIHPEPKRKGLKYELETIETLEGNDDCHTKKPRPPPKHKKFTPIFKAADCDT